MRLSWPVALLLAILPIAAVIEVSTWTSGAPPRPRTGSSRPASSAPSRASSRAPQTARFAGSGYVDCARLGSVVHVPRSAAPTQSSPTASSLAGGAAALRALVLTGVTVARVANRLCVDLEAQGPPDATTFYEFLLRKKGSGQSGPLVVMQFGFDASGTPRVGLKYPGADESPTAGHVRAQVGVMGYKISVVIDREVFPSWAPFDDFQFNAESIAQGAPGARFQQYTDQVSGADVSYPEGQASG